MAATGLAAPTLRALRWAAWGGAGVVMLAFVTQPVSVQAQEIGRAHV